MNHEILENAAWLAATEFAELHIAHVWEAYGEQVLRSARSPYRFDADAYVESEQERSRTAMNAGLAEVRESLAGEMLPAFNPVCHVVKGSRRDGILRLGVSLGADPVVVGTAARSEVSALVIESAAA